MNTRLKFPRKSPTSLLMTALMLVVFGCDSPTTSIVDEKSKLPQWKMDPEFESALGSRLDLMGISLRPPAGYEQRQQDGPAGAQMVGWVGQTRDNGTAPMVQLMVATIPDGEPHPTPSNALDRLLAGVQRGKQDWSHTTQRGVINGIEFAKAEWTGRYPSVGDLAGFMYVAVENGIVYQLATQDLLENAESDLKVGHAAIMTVKRVSQSP